MLTFTHSFLILVTMSLLLYTATAWQIKQPAISPTVQKTAWNASSVAMFLGIILGHWLYPIRNPFSHRVGSVLPFLGVMMLVDLYWIICQDGRRTAFRWPGWWATLGIIAGTLFWAQTSKDAPF